MAKRHREKKYKKKETDRKNKKRKKERQGGEKKIKSLLPYIRPFHNSSSILK